MISIIIPCKNRLNHLSVTFPLVKKMEGDFEIIVVDYNCPMGTGEYISVNYPGRAKIVRADVGPLDWNLSRARNLGVKEASGNALLFIDADTKVRHNFLVEHPLNPGEFYTGSWLHGSGCCLVWRSDFEKVRGYNEALEGWGTEDYCLYRRLEGFGLKRNYFNEKLFFNMKHHDKIRNEYHGRKDIHQTNEENYQKSIMEFISCIE